MHQIATLTKYCLPYTNNCMTMSEWAVYWQALSAIATAIVGTWGIVKIRSELRRLNEQRENEKKDAERDAKLKRTEFFLEQHRRLFDNEELFEILCLIDDDSAELRKPDMADKKRKFLTFLEEMALLVQSEQIDKSVAYYMFGYYAICVKKGMDARGNYSKGLDTSPEHWGLFFKFTSAAEDYFANHPDGPSEGISL